MAPRPATQLRKQVIELIGLALRRHFGEGESPSRQNQPEWDSLKNIELMFLLEDQFGVRFTEDEMARMEDADAIAGVLEGRTARAS